MLAAPPTLNRAAQQELLLLLADEALKPAQVVAMLNMPPGHLALNALLGDGLNALVVLLVPIPLKELLKLRDAVVVVDHLGQPGPSTGTKK